MQAFCLLCRSCWHGYSNVCLLRGPVQKIVEQYAAGTPQQKAVLEEIYTKPILLGILKEIWDGESITTAKNTWRLHAKRNKR
ncbi:hypothetical protein HK098_007199 [Nowakowskiella sp. JEL0407]|nr:hypothetical protein HK098_007199 [Nowakowskiella sp. JEL0407]